jgi:hypothetical protein
MHRFTLRLVAAAFAIALTAAQASAGGPAGGLGFSRSWGTGWNAPGSTRAGMYPLGPSPQMPRTTGQPLILQSPRKELVPMPPLRYQYVPPVRYPAPYFQGADTCCDR